MANQVWVYIDHFKGNGGLMSWEAVGRPSRWLNMGTGVRR
jgi:hypothetical protein